MSEILASAGFENILEYDRYVNQAKRIGQGSFGEIRLGVDTHTGLPVAMKIVKNMGGSSIPKAMFREMEALKQLSDCRYICQLLDVFVEESSIVLVQEYLCSDLQEVITNATVPPERSVVKGYLKMTLEALAFCHERNVIHRDIKPANILLAHDGTVKLGDFGLARVLPQGFEGSLSHQVATRWYRAPELLFASRHYDSAADIWSLGAVAAELLTLAVAFPGNNDIDQLYRVFQTLGAPTEERWPGVSALPDFQKVSFPDMVPLGPEMFMPEAHADDTSFLMAHFLQLAPQQRLTARAALTHPYLTTTAPLPAAPGPHLSPRPRDVRAMRGGSLSVATRLTADGVRAFCETIFEAPASACASAPLTAAAPAT